MDNKIANIVATYFGLGLSKFAPGTMGSLGTLPLAYALMYWGGFWALIITAVIIFGIGVWATDIVIKDTGIKDPSKVVIDETVGQLLSFSIVAFIAPEYLLGYESWLFYVAAFLFFRFFDILKMGPVKYFDTKVLNAYGVMLDDVFAGLFAAVCLLVMLYIKINL
jgi:phosphatidylglycerophosphatase A